MHLDLSFHIILDILLTIVCLQISLLLSVVLVVSNVPQATIQEPILHNKYSIHTVVYPCTQILSIFLNFFSTVVLKTAVYDIFIK